MLCIFGQQSENDTTQFASEVDLAMNKLYPPAANRNKVLSCSG